jgi:hypothetical protein
MLLVFAGIIVIAGLWTAFALPSLPDRTRGLPTREDPQADARIPLRVAIALGGVAAGLAVGAVAFRERQR